MDLRSCNHKNHLEIRILLAKLVILSKSSKHSSLILVKSTHRCERNKTKPAEAEISELQCIIEFKFECLI